MQFDAWAHIDEREKKMTNPDDIESIITGAFSLIGLFGVPVALFAGPVVSIVRGVFGIANSREERKKQRKQKTKRELEQEIEAEEQGNV